MSRRIGEIPVTDWSRHHSFLVKFGNGWELVENADLVGLMTENEICSYCRDHLNRETCIKNMNSTYECLKHFNNLERNTGQFLIYKYEEAPPKSTRRPRSDRGNDTFNSSDFDYSGASRFNPPDHEDNTFSSTDSDYSWRSSFVPSDSSDVDCVFSESSDEESTSGIVLKANSSATKTVKTSVPKVNLNKTRTIKSGALKVNLNTTRIIKSGTPKANLNTTRTIGTSPKILKEEYPKEVSIISKNNLSDMILSDSQRIDNVSSPETSQRQKLSDSQRIDDVSSPETSQRRIAPTGKGRVINYGFLSKSFLDRSLPKSMNSFIDSTRDSRDSSIHRLDEDAEAEARRERLKKESETYEQPDVYYYRDSSATTTDSSESENSEDGTAPNPSDSATNTSAGTLIEEEEEDLDFAEFSLNLQNSDTSGYVSVDYMDPENNSFLLETSHSDTGYGDAFSPKNSAIITPHNSTIMSPNNSAIITPNISAITFEESDDEERPLDLVLKITSTPKQRNKESFSSKGSRFSRRLNFSLPKGSISSPRQKNVKTLKSDFDQHESDFDVTIDADVEEVGEEHSYRIRSKRSILERISDLLKDKSKK